MTVEYRRAEPSHRPVARRKTDGSKERIKQAFLEAWEQGTTFLIEMHTEGMVRVKKGREVVCYYEDAEAFAKDMFNDE